MMVMEIPLRIMILLVLSAFMADDLNPTQRQRSQRGSGEGRVSRQLPKPGNVIVIFQFNLKYNISYIFAIIKQTIAKTSERDCHFAIIKQHLDHHVDHHVDHQGGEDAEDDE